MRRPGATARPVHRALDRRGVQLVAGLGREQQVVRALALGAGSCTSGSTRSATGTRRLLPDLVTFASTPSGAARLTRSTGIGTRTKSRTRTSRSSDHRSPVHDATSRTSASRWFRARDGHVERLQLVLGERADHGAHPAALGDPGTWSPGWPRSAAPAPPRRRTPTATPGTAAPTTRPARTGSARSAPASTSRSVTAPIWRAASAGGISRGSAAVGDVGLARDRVLPLRQPLRQQHRGPYGGRPVDRPHRPGLPVPGQPTQLP